MPGQEWLRSRLQPGATRSDDRLEARLVWMLGSPRTGTTWLLNLLSLHARIQGLDEPLIGAHLGLPVAAVVGATQGSGTVASQFRVIDRFAANDDYFFSTRYRATWQPALRAMLLARLGSQFRDRGGDVTRDYLVIKEPHGSEGADVLVDVLPRSRLLMVVRDGRDALDSVVHAVQPGAWAADVATLEQTPAARAAFIESYARLWVGRTEIARKALAQQGAERGLLVRYEDLLADTAAGLTHIYAWLGLPTPADLADQVHRLSFDQLPAAAKGTGQFARAATPGLWRENLSADEARTVIEIMGPTLLDLGYEL